METIYSTTFNAVSAVEDIGWFKVGLGTTLGIDATAGGTTYTGASGGNGLKFETLTPNSYIATAQFDCSEYRLLNLLIGEQLTLNDPSDVYKIEYSIDGGAFQTLVQLDTDSFTWRRTTYVIDPEDGDQIQFKFTLVDNSSTSSTLELDDFSLVGYSLSIDTEPSTSTIHSCYRPIRYVVTSNASTISKVQCEVYINGTLVKTIVHDPDINTTNQFTFDIQGFVRDNLSVYLPFSSVFAFSPIATGTFKYIHCVFNEVRLTAGVLVVQSTDYTSSTAYSFGGILQHEETQSWTNYYQDNSSKLFLTNQPDNSRVKRGEVIGIPFLLSTATDVTARIYQYQGTTLLSTSFGLTSTFSSSDKVGWLEINTQYLNTLTTKIVVELTNTAVSVISSQRTYTIVSEGCEDDKRIWFMNQYGGFEAFTFDGEFVEGLSVTAQEYKKILAYNFSITDRGLDTFRVDAFEKFRTSTRPLNREEYRWLKELKISPKLFLQEGSNFIPIIQLERDNYKIEGNNIGIPMTLDYVKANDLLTQ